MTVGPVLGSALPFALFNVEQAHVLLSSSHFSHPSVAVVCPSLQPNEKNQKAT
jgi:hypothetical protein